MWIAGALPNAQDSGRGVAVEDGAVFGEGDFFAASFAGCQSESSEPRSTSSISWRDSSNGTRNSTSGFTSRCLREDALRGGGDRLQVAGADGRESGTSRAMNVHDAPLRPDAA